MTRNASSGFGTDGGRTTEREAGDGARDDDGTRTNGGSAALDSLTDPVVLADREDVTVHERTYTHESPDHCEAEAAGRVVVGVTNDDGEVLLLVTEADEHAILPNCVTEDDGDWVDTALRTVEESTGVAIELEAVERLREVDHEVETDGEPRHQRTTHHVLFRGSPRTDADYSDPVVPDDSDWTAGWYDEVPVDVDDEGDVTDDIRTFLE